MTRLRPLTGGIGIVVLICLGSAAPAAPVDVRPVTVTTPVVEPMTSTWELTGSMTARRQSRLSARTSGLIERLQVDAGDAVAEGDSLMELDTALAQLALEKAVTARRQAEAELEEAQRLVTESRGLAKVGGFSRSEAETRETNVRVRRALLDNLTVQVKEQEEMIERHRLPAPFGGVISQKLAEVGEWVQTGTPVLELVEAKAPWLDVQAPQEMYGALQQAMTEDSTELDVRVRLDAVPGVTLPARVTARVPVKDQVARTFLVRLELEDPEGLAGPGMSALVTFSLADQKPVLQVPRDAVVRQPDGSVVVWTAEDGDGHLFARPRTVQLGFSLTNRIEVLGGLEPTSRVVIRGNEGLRDGQVLSVLPDTSSRAADPKPLR